MFNNGNSNFETDADIQGLESEVIATNVGVINPYALAEVIKGEAIDWEVEADPAALLESILQVPYDQLFDPANGSPLYLEQVYEPGAAHLTKREAEPTVETIVEQLELQAGDGTTDVDGWVKKAAQVAAEAIIRADNRWVDIGDFFKGGAELFDPVQGAVGDCYLIAALSAVAWSRPYSIEHRTRPTDSAEGFTNMVEFNWDNNVSQIEVTDKLLMRGQTNIPKYARSSDAGEIWPGVYEKAYAKWKTNDSDDTPDIQKIAGGDPVRACSELTGLKRYYYATSMSADDIWTKVRANSMTGSTFNPMVAWTWPSGDSAPNGVNYNNANLVANHAYSIHGWDYRDGKKYIVLRNPWGQKEATVGVAGGYWTAYDRAGHYGPGFWRKVNLPTNDGLFAIEAATFKKYFRGFGLVM
jgi:hypothetical protein